MKKSKMTLKIGDKVRFLNDVGGGIITAFIDEKMVEVQTDDGFELPILATELLLDVASGFGSNSEGTNYTPFQQTKHVEEDSFVTLKTEDYRFEAFKGEAILAILPDNDTMLHVSDLKLYLINDSNYSIQYVVTESDGGVAELIKVGVLEPDTKLNLKRYGQTSISKIKSFRIQAHFFKVGLMAHAKSFDQNVSVDGLSFYKANTFSENDYFEQKALVFKEKDFDLKQAVEKLSDSDVIKVVQKKESRSAKPNKVQVSNPEIEEVDLHIEEIVDNSANMSNGEIMEIQMGRFETALGTAMKSDTKKVVFIHGVGNGRLKQEISNKLSRKYPELKYQDASFKEYGFGATMVYLK